MIGKIILEFIMSNGSKKILAFPCFGIHCTFILKYVNTMKLVMRGFEAKKLTTSN